MSLQLLFLIFAFFYNGWGNEREKEHVLCTQPCVVFMVLGALMMRSSVHSEWWDGGWHRWCFETASTAGRENATYMVNKGK